MVGVAVAWDDEATRQSWKRARRVYVAWFSIGLAALIGFAAYAGSVKNKGNRLVATGIHVKGTVLADPPFALKCGQVAVPIRFPVDRQDATYPFFVDGCSGNGLHKGDAVDVYYSPGNPGDFAVNGRASEGPVATFLAILGLVIGAFLVGGGAVRARRGHRIRRALQETTWQMRPTAILPYTSSWTRGRSVVALLDEDPHPVVIAQPFGVRSQDPSREQSLVVAGSGPDTYVFKSDRSSRLVLARRPRSERAMARAVAALRPSIE